MPTQKQTGTTPTPAELTAALGGSIETASAVSEVTRRLMGYFTSDAVNPGDRLPPERQLAQSMGVGRSAVREAIAALEVLGVVTVRPGSGTYLRGKASELLPQTLSWGMLIGAPKTRELIAVRHGLEVHAARLAARSATPQAITAISEHLQAMESSTADYEAFAAADMRFHQAVAAAAGSALLGEILQTARSLIRVWVERALSDPGQARLALSEHRAVFEAIRDGEPDRAAAAMNTHMDSAAERLSASLEQTEQE